MSSLKDIVKLMQPLKNRISLMVARGVVRLINDNEGLQVTQVSLLEDELRDKVERIQDYGFTSNPLSGSEAMVIFMGGNRDHGVVIRIDDRRYRLKGLKGGEVALYTDEGDNIHLKRDRHIEVNTLHLTINAKEDSTVNTNIHSVNCESYKVNAKTNINMTTQNIGIHANNASVTNSEGGEVTVSFSGSIKTSQDVLSKGGGISLNEHLHSGVDKGKYTTEKPVRD